MDPEIEASERAFKTSYADMILAWNRLEGLTRYLAEVLARIEGFEGQILTAHIGNKTLTDTIQALAEGYDDECKAHIAHFATGFGRLTSWRNYYVHGIVGMTVDGRTAFGFVNEIETKTKRLAAITEQVSASDVRKITAAISAFHSHASSIVGHVLNARGEHLFAYPPLSLTEKPTVPDQLCRDRAYLQSSAPPHQPSAE